MSQPKQPFSFGDAIRAACVLLAAFFLVKLFVLSEHQRLRPLGWGLLRVLEAALLTLAYRMVRLEAMPPKDDVLVARWLSVYRPSYYLLETVMAVTGAAFMLLGCMGIVATGSDEVWAGRVETRGIQPGEVVMMALFGVVGFFILCWRPMFEISRSRVVRFPFGRALGLSKRLDASSVRVISEAFMITNTATRLGEMIRGTVQKYRFELEMLPGAYSEERVAARKAYWRAQLGTPDGE